MNRRYDEVGIRTLLGVHSAGFPNLFIMGGFQQYFTHVAEIRGALGDLVFG